MERSVTHVVQLVSGVAVDGAARHAVDLASMLVARGVRVTLACREDAWAYQQVSSLPLLQRQAISFRRRRDNLRALKQRWAREGVELLHAHKTSACNLAALMQWRGWFPSVATAHHQSLQWHWLAQGHVIAPSLATAHYFRRRHFLSQHRVSVIPYPHHANEPTTIAQLSSWRASFRSAHGLSESDFVVGCVGSVEPRKNLMVLVKALHRTEKGNARIVLLAAGTPFPEYVSKVLREAHRLGVSDRVRIVGVVNEMQRVYAGVDVLCLPSLHEQLPLAILEAMTAGTPVICSPVGGLKELIRPGVDGLFVAPRDVVGWANAIGELVDSPHQRIALSRAAQTRVAEFCAPDRCCDQIQSVYSSVLARHRL